MRLCHFSCHRGNQKSHSEVNFFNVIELSQNFLAHGLISLSRPAFNKQNIISILNSSHNIPTSSVAPFPAYTHTQPTIPPIALTKG